MEQGLSEWEWNQLKMVIKSDSVRKRFREELDYLEQYGNLLIVIKSNDLLAHLLAYAWKDFYRVALVCKRFNFVTKTRAYWGALAKHYFKSKLPAIILKQVNFFHMLPEEKPAYTYLQGIFKIPRSKTPFVARFIESIRLVYPSVVSKHERVFSVGWIDNNPIEYFISHYLAETGKYTRVSGATQICEFFNDLQRKKLTWTEMKDPNNDEIICVNTYCEVYDPERNQTWYGQPGKPTSCKKHFLSASEMMPGPLSWGVWK